MLRHLRLSILLGITACRLPGPSAVKDDRAGMVADCGREAFQGDSSPHYFDLKDKIQADPAKYPNRQAVLENLLSKDYRRYYALVYQSTSVQSASPKSPRILYFGSLKEPNFMIGVAGTEPASGPDAALEIIEYSKSQRRFCFRSINFEGNGATFEDDPDDCKSCHSPDGRPLWEPFNTWPAIFGSRGNKMAAGSSELSGFQSFTQTQRLDGVYKYLTGPQDLSHSQLGGAVSFINSSQISAIETLVEPLSAFTSALEKMNFQRLIRLLEESDKHERYKYAILASFAGCPNIPDFLPMELRVDHPKTIAEIFDKTKSQVNSAANQREALINANNSGALDNASSGVKDSDNAAYLQTTANLRYLLESRLTNPVGMANWSMSRFRNAYSFAAEEFGITDLGFTYVESDFFADPDIYPLAHNASIFNTAKRSTVDQATIDQLCSLLKSKSLGN